MATDGSWLSDDRERVMVLLAGQVCDEWGDPAHRRLVQTTCEFVRRAVSLLPTDDPRPRAILSIVEGWAAGDHTITRDDLGRAADSADRGFAPTARLEVGDGPESNRTQGDCMEPLRFELFDDDNRSKVVIDPFAVATVKETRSRRAYGGEQSVAVIRLHDGKEYTVHDDSRTVASRIWLGRARLLEVPT